jgi:hypothetical protein
MDSTTVRSTSVPVAQETREIKDKLWTLAEKVEEGEMPAHIGTVLNQIYNTLLRAMDQERRARETVELEERLAVLEEQVPLRRGASA